MQERENFRNSMEIVVVASYLRQIIIVKLLLNCMCGMTNRRCKSVGDTQLKAVEVIFLRYALMLNLSSYGISNLILEVIRYQ